MKRIFISFAMEDKFARDNLVHQAQRQNVPFSFVDMSVKQPWDYSWKTNCRERIKGCDGVVAFVSNNTFSADGAKWEIKCAYEEGIPVLPVYVHDEGASRTPVELSGKRIYHWTWTNITNFINSL
jgi:nucleoside 2-deoxyribosyltransferase